MKLNLPNKITVFRLFCVIGIIILGVLEFYLKSVPSFIVFNKTYTYTRLIILILFVIGSISDMLDGYIARKYNMITTFGKFLDPIADKLLVNEVAILLTIFGDLPIFVVIIYIFRDTFVDGIRFIAASKNKVIAASKLGKLKTNTQMISLICVLALAPFSTPDSILNIILFILVSISAFCSLISGIDYLIKNKKIIVED